MISTLLNISRQANLDSITESRHLLKKILIMTGMSVKKQQNILLVFSELMTNSVEHGIASFFKVTFSRMTHTWLLKLSYNGKEFNPFEQDLFSLDDVYCLENESGRGCFLAKQLTDLVNYECIEGVNHVQLEWNRPNNTSKKKLLVVCDDHFTTQVIKAMCKHDYSLETTNCAQRALEKLETGKFDLILSDLQMPDMNGLEFRIKLLLNDSLSSVPFLFMTGESDLEMIDQAIHLEVDAVIHKPLTKNLLIQSLNRAWIRSQQLKVSYSKKVDEKIIASLPINVPATSHGWEFVHASRNTGAGGGDFCTFKESASSSSFLLADIMGHDETAKFFALSYFGFLRGFCASYEEVDGKKLIESINKIAHDDPLFSQTMLTTIACNFYPSGKIKLTNAGHVQPLLISPDNIQTISESDMVPGLMADVTFSEKTYEIKSEERLVFLTDGFFESAGSPHARKALEIEMTNVLKATLEEPLKLALDKIMQEFDRIVGSPCPDDVFIMLAEHTKH